MSFEDCLFNMFIIRIMIACSVIIEYSCPSGFLCVCVCVCVCVSVCVCDCVHDNSKNNGSIHLKLEHVIVYENSSDEFDIGHCLIKVKVMA